MMRWLGMVLLVIGIILAASAGIRLGSSEYGATTEEGRVALAGAPARAVVPVGAVTRLGDWFDAAGILFLAGLLLVTAGAVMGRVAITRDGSAAATADGHDFAGQLALLAASVDEMRSALGDEPLPASRSRIDRALQEVVTPMIDARGALQRRFGIGGGALVVGPLSGAERQLNRAWSVLVDEHVEEAARSLDAAAVELTQARQALAELEAH